LAASASIALGVLSGVAGVLMVVLTRFSPKL
jgi:hypothetical protein